MNDLEICVSLLNDFINDKLDNNLDNILSYNLFNTLHEKKYGELQNLGNPEKFDPDNSEIAKAIYFIVWHTQLPKIELSQIGTGKLYRGDTLNTFNTLFSRNFERLNKFGGDSISLIEKAKEFKKLYFCIGNFVLLPNKSVILEGFKRNETLNTYRGSFIRWKDYFDKFLYELDLCINVSSDKDKGLFQIYKANDFYFNKFDTIDKFSTLNFLEMYFTADKKNLLPFKEGLTNWNKDRSNEYIEFGHKYIELSQEIIRTRGIQIVNILKKYI
jgi:hypothetical protein